MDKIAIVHHSLKDWDLNPGHTLNLSAAHFVSSPTSLRSNIIGQALTRNRYYLKEAISGVLKHGQAVWWHWPAEGSARTHGLHFRAQEFATGFEPKNAYYFRFWNLWPTLSELVNGATTRHWPGPGCTPAPANAWTRYRVSWWSWLNEFFVPTMTVIGERLEAGKWVQRHQVQVTNPLWEDSSINRVGFSVYGYYNEPRSEWVDDIEIWKAIE